MHTGTAPVRGPALLLFLRSLPSNHVARESTTGRARATYLFRVVRPVDTFVAPLTPGHGLVNPGREPMCPHELVDQPPPYHRYAIAVRKLPDLGGRSPHF